MIRRRIFTAIAVVLVAASTLTGVAWRGNAYAAQTSTVAGDALKVSPVRWDISMDPGTTKIVDLYIQNLTSVPAILHPAINDFTASGDETGKPNVILDEDKFAPSHSFKKFAKPLSDVLVQPKEQKNVKLTVTVPKDAAGGGYYGAVRFSPASLDGDKNVNLSASVGSLILLKVNGSISEQLKIAGFDVHQKEEGKQAEKKGPLFNNNKNLSVVVRFKNDGNIQVGPFGNIIIKKGGKVIHQEQVNNVDPRGVVLPDSVRRFEVPVNKVGTFGKYTVEGSFGYGSTGQLLTAKTKFYVVPVYAIVTAVVAVLVLVALLFIVPRMIRNYNKRVIRRASRRR